MATIDVNAQMTLLELARRTDPKGSAAVIAEILAEDNEVWQDIPWSESNMLAAHRVTRRTSKPAGTWRQLNAGVGNETSTTETVDEGIGMLESYSEVDKWLIDNAPDPRAARMDEARSFIEGMGETFVKTLFNRALAVNYGNATVAPERFNGFPARYNALVTNQVIGASGTGNDTTSIWIVQWGLNRVFCIYPKGSPNQGIIHRDLGEVTLLDASSLKYQGFRDHFKIEGGLVVKDPRCVARVANIESAGSTNIFDEDHLITALTFMPQAGKGAVIYTNKTIRTQMQIIAKDKTNQNLSYDQVLSGAPVLSFMGCPVRLIEQLGNTETAIA